TCASARAAAPSRSGRTPKDGGNRAARSAARALSCAPTHPPPTNLSIRASSLGEQRLRTATAPSILLLVVPPLNLDHHRQQVLHVDARDCEHAVVISLLVDDVDAVVACLPLLCARQDVVELGFGGNRQPEVVETRALHFRAVVLGDQEHELLDRVHLE